MAKLTAEETVGRLTLLGAISQLSNDEQAEIYQLRDSIKALCKQASRGEFAFIALGLLSVDLQEEE